MKNGNDVALPGIIVHAKTIAVDSMCFIYHFEDHFLYADITSAIFSHIVSGRAEGVTSVISLLEALTLARATENASQLHALYKARFLEMVNLSVRDVTVPIVEGAATLRTTYRLKLGDAIQLATAIAAKADIFMTNDIALRRVKELNVCILNDYVKKN